MRPHRRTEDVIRRVDVGYPVAHRFVDRVLERRRAGLHGPHLGTESLHAQHVGLLPFDVARAHVHDARQPEQRRDRGRCNAVLARAGLGYQACLAQALGEEALAQDVVDLVRACVREVLALEIEVNVEPELAAPGDRPDTAASAVQRTLAPSSRNSAQNVGSRRMSPYVCSSSRSAAMRVSGTKRPPRSRLRSPAAPIVCFDEAGCDQVAAAKASRAGRIGRRGRALANRATASGSLRGGFVPPTSTPDATSTPRAGTSRTASATFSGRRPPASIAGSSFATSCGDGSSPRACPSRRACLRETASMTMRSIPAASHARASAEHRVGIGRGANDLPGCSADVVKLVHRLVSGQLNDVGVDGGDEAAPSHAVARRR